MSVATRASARHEIAKRRVTFTELQPWKVPGLSGREESDVPHDGFCTLELSVVKGSGQVGQRPTTPLSRLLCLFSVRLSVITESISRRTHTSTTPLSAPIT